MRKYRIYFADQDNGLRSFNVEAEDCNGAVEAAMKDAVEVAGLQQSDLQISLVWKDYGDHWIDYQMVSGHWQASGLIPKSSVVVNWFDIDIRQTERFKDIKARIEPTEE